MVIFNSYVKLPEGSHNQMVMAFSANSGHFRGHEAPAAQAGLVGAGKLNGMEFPAVAGSQTKRAIGKCGHQT